MDYEKLAVAIKLCGSTPKVDQCSQCPYWASGDMNNCIPRVTADAATAITDLLARAEASEARVKKLAEAIEREQRRAEKAEKERDAAVSDLETVMAYGGGNLDTCQFCKNGQCYVRGGTKLCLPKWRGKKED